MNTNYLHRYIQNQIAKCSSNNEKVETILELLEARGADFLKLDEYNDLYIKPDEDILNSKPQVIQQVRDELADFLKLMLVRDAKSFLQIGLGTFATTHLAASFICDNVTSVEFDINRANNWIFEEPLSMKNDFVKHNILIGDSTVDKVIECAGKHGPYDFLLIDANHSYEYVKADHDNYAPFVKTGGIVAFHDALLEGDRYGTPRFLKELDKNLTYITHSKEVGIACYVK
tara:strand:+ start:890 stop:1579 length:690 start_codon:yes stop_codon:yes gene_type:complete